MVTPEQSIRARYSGRRYDSPVHQGYRAGKNEPGIYKLGE